MALSAMSALYTYKTLNKMNIDNFEKHKMPEEDFNKLFFITDYIYYRCLSSVNKRKIVWHVLSGPQSISNLELYFTILLLLFCCYLYPLWTYYVLTRWHRLSGETENHRGIIKGHSKEVSWNKFLKYFSLFHFPHQWPGGFIHKISFKGSARSIDKVVTTVTSQSESFSNLSGHLWSSTVIDSLNRL